jgi:tagatose-6-phosphate ketose/aldose isomerase
MLFSETTEELKKLGAGITVAEIKQQPVLWQEAWTNYAKVQTELENYLKEIPTEAGKKVRVIFTGAGSSQYVGDTVVPHLRKTGDITRYTFESIATTDIVASPVEYLSTDTTTLLVSFGRSGNSPESIGAVQKAREFLGEERFYQLTITCAPEGKLAQQSAEDSQNFLLLMPALSNDKGFAMTGSFSCMLLSALLVFDQADNHTKESFVESGAQLGKEILGREAELSSYISGDIERIVYLGSGSLASLTREAQLKVLELTAGKIATVFDSSMGFRHGPKSFVNEQTLVIDFMNNDPYTRLYDVDILEEVHGDKIAPVVVGLTQVHGETNFSGTNFTLTAGTHLPDGYFALPAVLFAQMMSVLCSIKVGNTPDTPSKTGTVNRVVKGVTIH